MKNCHYTLFLMAALNFHADQIISVRGIYASEQFVGSESSLYVDPDWKRYLMLICLNFHENVHYLFIKYTYR